MKKKKWILIIAVVVIALVLGVWIWKSKTSVPEEPKYETIKVTRGDLSITILTTGTVAPENRLDIKPPVAGRIERVLVFDGDTVKKGQTLAWMSSTERAVLLDSARAQGPEELKKWEELYLATPIFAPIDGTIIVKNVESGQTVGSGDAVYTMSDRLIVQAQVDETDISQIHLKQKAAIILDAYPGKTIDATVDHIAYDSKTVNNVTTYVADVLPKKTPPYMRSGMTANVTFVGESKRNILLIPSEALKVKDGHYYVFVPSNDPEKRVEKIVETGASDGKMTEITSGLEENETVLVTQFDPSKLNSKAGVNPFMPSKKSGGPGGHH